ncbi:MAG: class I SAM-dependent methyltransferase [Pseudomonadota bacterium]
MSEPQILSEIVSCDLCGSTDQDILYTRFDPVTKQEFHLVECRCGMAFVNPMPTAHSIPMLYPDDYLKDKQDMRSMYHRMMTFLPEQDDGVLLDVGCGRGDFIKYASGFGRRVEGVDLLSWRTPHDVPIRVGDFVSMELPERHYKVITAWAVLEHVRNPSAFFGKISRLLREDGRFVFVVPNFDAPGMRHSCTEDIPRHLHLFTPKAVKAHLNNHGMEVRKIYHDDGLYTAYPFGLLRYLFFGRRKGGLRCTDHQNRSVAILRNRQIKGNLATWLAEVLRTVGPGDLILDAIDLALGVALANISKLMGNYGVITVVASVNGQKKSNPHEEDC